MAALKAILADDEPHIRADLRARLQKAWPELILCGEAGNGPEALALIAAMQPDVAFLDIRMPGLSGLEVARQIAGACRVVFVTAYDQYAVDAFESAALDYLLKPVTDERLAKTIERLQRERGAGQGDTTEAAVQKLLATLQREARPAYLQWLTVQAGKDVRLLPVREVYYFQAEDKYTTVRTREGEWLISKSITSLEDELDPEAFWRIHRATIVNVAKIARARRTFTGGLVLELAQLDTTLAVSRTYAHLFRQMWGRGPAFWPKRQEEPRFTQYIA